MEKVAARVAGRSDTHDHIVTLMGSEQMTIEIVGQCLRVVLIVGEEVEREVKTTHSVMVASWELREYAAKLCVVGLIDRNSGVPEIPRSSNRRVLSW